MRWYTCILLFVLISCKKAEDRNCFKSTGDPATKEIELAGFEKLYLGPHLQYVLVQDTVNKVVLSGGKNLLNLVETSVDDQYMLSVRNNNKCNFLRDYDKVITVEIHFKKIYNILFEGTHELTCPFPIQSDYFTLVIRDGAGKLNLNLNAYELHTEVTYGWGNFDLSGNVNYLNLDIGGDGFGSTYGMNVSDSIVVVSNTTETVMVNANGCRLHAQTLSSGDIWYKGYPSGVIFSTYGTGELIDKN